MDTTLTPFTLRFHPATDAAKLNQHPKRTQPVRLPQGTADLVNRLLAARCGASR
jgi:hypothetical protein